MRLRKAGMGARRDRRCYGRRPLRFNDEGKPEVRYLLIQLIASTRLLLVLELYYRPRLVFDREKVPVLTPFFDRESLICRSTTTLNSIPFVAALSLLVSSLSSLLLIKKQPLTDS